MTSPEGGRPPIDERLLVDLLTCDRATSADVLAAWVRDARARTIDLVSDLDDQQLIGPKLPTVNPLLWEIGHAAWFQEHWVLQHAAGLPPIRRGDEHLFDSISIDHDVRWDLPLPTRASTLRYLGEVRDRVCDVLAAGKLDERLIYFVKLSVFHEDMHTEAFTYTRQTLAYSPPQFCPAGKPPADASPVDMAAGDVEISGGEYLLGASPDAPFVFDNEKWVFPVQVASFEIARTAVMQGEFAVFVDDGGYERQELWGADGWQWREQTGAAHPVYWKKEGDQWMTRQFDRWLPLEANKAVIHVNWYEADAFCRWAGRRLPTEAEWELAAGGMEKRHYPWGDEPPSDQHANLDWRASGTVDAAAFGAGESPFGCRQMLGNVWEWTATTFGPFPGFVVDPYKEYSTTCFDQCKVLRGGCWTTRSRLLRNTWRNFYMADRRDVLAGFRTCAK